MNIVGRAAGFSGLKGVSRILVALSCSFCCSRFGLRTCQAHQDAPAPPQAPPQAAPTPPYAQQTPEQLQELVAPIALYPDSLVAQILAASTFPEQVVEADRWVQDASRVCRARLWLKRWTNNLGIRASRRSRHFHPSSAIWTKTSRGRHLSATPTTTSKQEVMDAVQAMRQRAEAAGNLKTTSQQTVTNQGSTIVVQPANPDIVYVPAYDPWMVYGDPLMAWPGWYPYPGIWFGGPYLSFGMGFGIGFFGGFGWGWNHWGFNWGGHFATFGGGRYFSRSNTFYNRNAFYRGGGFNRGGALRGGAFNRGGGRGFNRGGGMRGAAVSARGPAFQRKQPGGSRIRVTSRTEGYPLRRLQRLRAWRTGKELFIPRKVELRRRRISWRWRISRRGGGFHGGGHR